MKSFEELIEDIETEGYLLRSLHLTCNMKGTWQCDLRQNNEVMTIKSGLGWSPAEALSNAMSDDPRFHEDDPRNPFPYMSPQWKEWCRGSGHDYPRIVRPGAVVPPVVEKPKTKVKLPASLDADLF